MNEEATRASGNLVAVASVPKKKKCKKYSSIHPIRETTVKKLIVPLVLGAALLIPGHAAAKSRHYAGAVSPSGSIGFNVVQKKHSKKKSVNGFTFSGIPVTCADGPATTHGDVTFPVKLHKNGSFNISASSSVTGASLQVSGNLSAGTIHLSGDLPLDPSGTGSGCDSGVLSWTAQRG